MENFFEANRQIEENFDEERSASNEKKRKNNEQKEKNANKRIVQVINF